VFEINRLFDSPDGALRSAGSGLRVRVSRSPGDPRVNAATVTFKGPREAAALKIREEIETGVADPDEMLLILRRLGFQEIATYEKKRETWKLNACEICLDELPVLGCYCEIEGPDEQTVLAVGELLGLRPDNLTQDTYPGLIARRGRKNAEGRRTLLFDETT